MDKPLPDRPRETRSAPVAHPWDMKEEITTIGAQQKETLALLRQLIDMLLPKVDPDKPKLEELIAALVGQQTRMLILVRQIGADLSDLMDRLPEGRGKPNGRHAGNGGVQP
ncbi:MAG: hypothetical protein ABI369_02780 [Acetobacteraceae bacterium]